MVSTSVDAQTEEKVTTLAKQAEEGTGGRELRDEHFNKYRFMVPQGKRWHVKASDQPAGPVGPPQPTGLTGATDQSDHPEQPVRRLNPV